MQLSRYLLSTSLALLVLPFMLFAQGKRPEILIYGDGIDAYAAAIQAAKSNLNTVWIWESGSLGDGMVLQPGTMTSHHNLDAGIWADLLSASLGGEQRSDSLASLVKRRINPQLLLNAMEKEISKFPHLTVIRGGQIQSAKRGRKNWQIRLADRRSFSIRAVVDATENGEVARLAGLSGWKEHTQLTESYFGNEAIVPLTRTGVAVSDLGNPLPYTIPLGALIPTGDENIFFTKNTQVVKAHTLGTLEDLPLLAHIGQAVGAAAGYVAFYKTTSDKIAVRQVQGELVQYGARLLPFQDIAQEDPHFQAIQLVGITGLLQPRVSEDGALRYLFDPAATVSTDELSPTMNQLFSRSQIWFADHQADQLTLAELMSLIKYIGHRGDELEALIQKNWERQFKLPGSYDPAMKVSRRHVAVLLHAYGKPADVRVDLAGKIVR